MNLQEELKEELKTMYHLIGVMKPKNEAEFINVTLPNLHLKVFKLVNKENHQDTKRLEDYLFKIVNKVVDYFDIDRKDLAQDKYIADLVMMELLNIKK